LSFTVYSYEFIFYLYFACVFTAKGRAGQAESGTSKFRLHDKRRGQRVVLTLNSLSGPSCAAGRQEALNLRHMISSFDSIAHQNWICISS
jgi:hypothetical protein